MAATTWAAGSGRCSNSISTSFRVPSASPERRRTAAKKASPGCERAGSPDLHQGGRAAQGAGLAGELGRHNYRRRPRGARVSVTAG